jgi:hypothetical protein
MQTRHDAKAGALTGDLAEPFGELGVELEDRAGTSAAQLLVELGDDHVGPDAVQEVAGVRPSIASPSTDPMMSIVACASSMSGDSVSARSPSGRAGVDLLGDVVVGDRFEGQRDAQLVVTEEAHLRAHFDHRPIRRRRRPDRR